MGGAIVFGLMALAFAAAAGYSTRDQEVTGESAVAVFVTWGISTILFVFSMWMAS